MNAKTRLLFIAPLLGLSVLCGAHTTRPAARSDSRTELLFTIYYTDDNIPLAPAEVRKELANQPGNAKWSELLNSGQGDGVSVTIVPSEKYPSPTQESLKYFGRGITNQDAQKLQKSKLAMILVFKRDWSRDYAYLHAAEMVAHSIAEKTHGFIWDEAARLMYDPANYKKLVLDNWSNDIPSARRDVVLHEYADGDHMRTVSLGMEKFGLPNLVINDFPRSSASPLGSLLVLCAQAMIENRPAHPGADVSVNIDEIKQKDVREWLLPTLLEGATKRDTLHFISVQPEEGDAETPLYEISFDHEAAATRYERQVLIVDRLFGKHDESMGVKHDAEMLALVEKAQKEFQALKSHFQAGLLPGERLLVESPFHQGGKVEWMWVEVSKWNGDDISGSLQNDPDIVTSLKAGAPVQVKASEAFDYLFVHGDGSTAGNETSKLIEKRGH